MKNILYYFYLLCFLILIGMGIAGLIADQDYITSAILLQLIWGPISIIHCLYKSLLHRGNSSKVAILYKISLGWTVGYFVILFIITNLPDIAYFSDGTSLWFVGIGIIPWLMLAFFTYILHLESKEPEEQRVTVNKE